jgi:hypothetical protein
VIALLRKEPPADDLDELRARVAELETVVRQRAADVDRIDRELDMFAARYRQQVGSLHEQLDQLELDIAEAELGELSQSLAERGAQEGAAPSPASPPPGPRFALRTLFREVARAIHPDLAS